LENFFDLFASYESHEFWESILESRRLVPPSLRLGLMALYGPAIGALLWQAIVQPEVAQKLLAIALLLLSLDLLKMAIFDLEQVALVQSRWPKSSGQTVLLDETDSRLAWFQKVTIVTIGFELVGLYGAWISLSWGAIVILLSQVGFNLFAQVQLLPDQSEMIQPFGIRDRAIVLIADGLGLVLVAIGLSGRYSWETSAGLLGMVILYGVVKFSQERSNLS
jgi:hypothetical protein